MAQADVGQPLPAAAQERAGFGRVDLGAGQQAGGVERSADQEDGQRRRQRPPRQALAEDEQQRRHRQQCSPGGDIGLGQQGQGHAADQEPARRRPIFDKRRPEAPGDDGHEERHERLHPRGAAEKHDPRIDGKQKGGHQPSAAAEQLRGDAPDEPRRRAVEQQHEPLHRPRAAPQQQRQGLQVGHQRRVVEEDR